MTRRRGVRHRNAPAPWHAGELSLLFAVVFACGERERPDPLPDPPRDAARRFVGGGFGAPDEDAGAGGGAGNGGAAGAQADADASVAGAGGSGGSGDAGAGGSPALTSADPVTQVQTYEATCGESQVPQWGFVTYEASTPGDSFIGFRLRSAQTEAELAAATFIDLISVSTALGTTRCLVTGPAPECPIDLFVRLGGAPLAHLPFMEVEAVLHPASADQLLPRMNAWRMDYSCLDAL
jgi:hypothetical protein